ncbi:elongation of very long chain fatty acids protein AAEL008004-like isoform X1 [Pieris napi]|uniref:elongation of very long chain fatty acids protein AAEL008004-like isoform X1 n=1 Tax=Pieris napi TaxID=78633 RepID=UPI001FB98F6F|nr:elongation of very long chain fatty acids protein AAEL008004-like isoform X1 [Pieris napi]
MATLIGKLYNVHHFLFEELSDPRTKHWPLIGSPYSTIGLLTFYLLFVMKWGPKWMEKRKPFNLERILIAYNAIQVILCLYVFVTGIKVWYHYKLICEPTDFSESGLHAAKIVYCYFLLKVLDLFDTVFFVLRKKSNHVSFLHVYHHTGMVAIVWGCTTYYPGGHGTMVGLLNSFVHAVMYSYYLLTVADPSLKGSLWWKKYITQLQILQFLIMVLHMGSIVFIPDCGYPRWISAVFLPQNLFMLILFVDFYIKTYIKKPKTETKEEKVEKKIENTKMRRLIESQHLKENLNSRS